MVSIIIPVYNAENQITKCLSSVFAQTFHDLEIIIVNDGSTDDSGTICEEECRNHCPFSYKITQTSQLKNCAEP